MEVVMALDQVKSSKASARRAAKTAKAEARRKEAEAKRAARAQAKVTKQAEAEATQALFSVKASEVAKLVAELRLLVDNACDHFASQMREAAEISSRLRVDFGLTQFKIGAAIGRSQAWVSMILKWKEEGFPDTAFGHRARRGTFADYQGLIIRRRRPHHRSRPRRKPVTPTCA
jgi:hypothetical protein